MIKNKSANTPIMTVKSCVPVFHKSRLAAMVFFLIVFSCSSLTLAKDRDVSIRLKAKYDGNKILLRWAPSDMDFDYTYKLYKVTDGKETLSGTYQKVAIKNISKEVSPENSNLITSLLYPQSLYKKDTEKLEALSQRENQKGMAFFLAELKPAVANALGIRAEDANISPGKAYTYVLKAFQNTKLIAEQKVAVSTAKPTPLYPPSVTTRRYDWGCALRWTNFDFYTAFNIYRGSGENSEFKKINKSPISVNYIKKENGLVETPPYFYSDTTIDKAQAVYYYKVTGIDSFSDESPLSSASFAIRDASLRPAPQMPVSTQIIEPSIKISWTKDPENKLTGFNLYRSSLYKGNYEKLNKEPIKTLSYTDTNVKYKVNYFYCHTAIDVRGTESVMSLPRLAVLRDRTPPQVPQQLKAIAHKGAVELSWLAVTDKDFKGYELYRASSKDAADWAMLTTGNHTLPHYTDTMTALLDKKPYYYKVLAKDTEANRSDFSNIIEIKLPDVTPPKQPVWKAATSQNNEVYLEWRPSSTKDIAGYKVYKGRGNKSRLIAELPENITKFSDKSVSAGEKAWYYLTAVDGDKNESEKSSGIEVKNKDITPLSFKNLTIKNRENGVLISLNVKENDFSSMTVKRKNENQKQFKTIASNHKMDTFLDKYVDKNKKYTYLITAYDTSGNVTSGTELTISTK